jgi:hypothetical protein
LCCRYYYQKRTGNKHGIVLVTSEKYITAQIIICPEAMPVRKNDKKTNVEENLTVFSDCVNERVKLPEGCHQL